MATFQVNVAKNVVRDHKLLSSACLLAILSLGCYKNYDAKTDEKIATAGAKALAAEDNKIQARLATDFIYFPTKGMYLLLIARHIKELFTL